jgi:TBCC domain-containing protein 1
LAVGGNDAAVHAPVLVAASEFNMLLVPLESEAARQRRLSENDDAENSNNADNNNGASGNGNGGAGGAATPSPPIESPYCRLLAEALQLSPFRLPIEYERRVLMKAERMKNIQQSVKNNLTPEQQRRFEDELNRGFRDWLVSSGNLRQVLDLVRIDRRGGV